MENFINFVKSNVNNYRKLVLFVVLCMDGLNTIIYGNQIVYFEHLFNYVKIVLLFGIFYWCCKLDGRIVTKKYVCMEILCIVLVLHFEKLMIYHEKIDANFYRLQKYAFFIYFYFRVDEKYMYEEFKALKISL